MPESTIKLCEEADAILLGACGLPSVRYPDNTEIAPQIELRFIFDLYAGVRPARLYPGRTEPDRGRRQARHRSRRDPRVHRRPVRLDGQGHRHPRGRARDLVITRKTSERLFEFSFRLAERAQGARQARRASPASTRRTCSRPLPTSATSSTRSTKHHPDVKTDRLYVDACSAMLVKRPWDFDVMVMENMFGDILSDIAASLIGGMGMAPSADIGDQHAVFQPCHGTAPDIMGQGKANPPP